MGGSWGMEDKANRTIIHHMYVRISRNLLMRKMIEIPHMEVSFS